MSRKIDLQSALNHQGRDMWAGQPLHLVVGSLGRRRVTVPSRSGATLRERTTTILITACDKVVPDAPIWRRWMQIGYWPPDACPECAATAKQQRVPKAVSGISDDEWDALFTELGISR